MLVLKIFLTPGNFGERLSLSSIEFLSKKHTQGHHLRIINVYPIPHKIKKNDCSFILNQAKIFLTKIYSKPISKSIFIETKWFLIDNSLFIYRSFLSTMLGIRKD